LFDFDLKNYTLGFWWCRLSGVTSSFVALSAWNERP